MKRRFFRLDVAVYDRDRRDMVGAYQMCLADDVEDAKLIVFALNNLAADAAEYEARQSRLKKR